MHLGPFQSHAHPSVDLGETPPLVVYDERNALPDRRKVSLRWLTGTVLTGLTSVMLMGGALMAALDGQYRVAAATNPEPDPAAVASTLTSGTKGDRVSRRSAQFTNRQVIPVNVITRVGDRDFIKAKPYVLVNASLASRKTPELTARIPEFNPLQMFSDGQKAATDRAVSDGIYSARAEGEFSITQSDFPVNSPMIDLALTPDEAAVAREVSASAQMLADDSIDMAGRTIVDPGRFDFSLARLSDFDRLQVRITQENVSFVSKQEDETVMVGIDERILPVLEGQDLKDLLVDNDASDVEAESILAALRHGAGVVEVKEGERLRIGMAADPNTPGRMRPERVSIYGERDHKVTVARADNGTYVVAAAPTDVMGDAMADAFAEASRAATSTSGSVPSLYEGIYLTALEQEIPEPLIGELVRAFSYDVDFNARVQPGDAIEVFYGLTEDGTDEPAEILYASLTTSSTLRRLYRFRTPDDGEVDYYDEAGRSAKKFLMRKPLSGGVFRSGFGMRRHPIHGFAKMHTGVDWSASRGVPIMAAGNGTVIKSEWVSGYGKRVEIRHANGYVTTYSHMNDFAKGIVEGTRVTQGQIIGYIGSTGLSTGPHLHYEVLVNNNFVDPMRIRLPRGRVLEGEMLAAFEEERDRIDALLDRGPRSSRVASASTVAR
ncbi:peptidoglycan DD-metalloendopeptidase family protein [Microvirga tunisiensis]|uniref:Peptidoglycan DD-metalloendopeptidase family protein n=2 Tax=Pannonibacter tanglangensis TaxID=2750084 RepID=A0A7X5JBI8_9HYPH|nr:MULTISPECIES: M23 family metallopeptidase [unclassified Pannonibacter]NBN66041.1 peptidoglycan DD-metalloendopeptidase family protein [Pannonibacter sp. XCT-34]NBN80536.1 peptidoglycan DD-metalloendopeptidase family protein [Pannonibacter sp. XCT-53]